MRYDISKGLKASRFPVSYLNEVPKGGWSDEYKTSKIVLRRVEGGVFDRKSKNGESYSVQITQPYYLGVFEVTQRQWELVMGTRPSAFKRNDCYRMRPVESVGYGDIRGRELGMKWPKSSDVDAGSFVGVLRKKARVHVDLPTLAQLEFAYRKGGHPKSGQLRNQHNSSKALLQADEKLILQADTTMGTAAVGAYEPNSLGIYDMIGKVEEACLDRVAIEKESEDPIGGVESAGNSLWTGNGWVHGGNFEVKVRKTSSGVGYTSGFRLCLGPDLLAAKPKDGKK